MDNEIINNIYIEHNNNSKKIKKLIRDNIILNRKKSFIQTNIKEIDRNTEKMNKDIYTIKTKISQLEYNNKNSNNIKNIINKSNLYLKKLIE